MIVELAFLVIGILIGVNWRNEYAERKENRSLEQIDESIRSELAVAKNLNKSLLDDVKFLRAKLQRAQNKNDK